MHFFTNYSKTTRISFIRGSQSSMLPVASTVVIVTVAGSRRSRRDRPSTLPTSSKLPVVIAILATTTPVTEIHNRCRRQKSPVGIHTGWTLPPQPLAPSWGGGREFSVISRKMKKTTARATQPRGRGRPVHGHQAAAAVAYEEEYRRHCPAERHPRPAAGAAVQRPTETRPSTAKSKSDRRWRGRGAEAPRRPRLVSSRADASSTVAPWPLTSDAAALPRTTVFVPQSGHLPHGDAGAVEGSQRSASESADVVVPSRGG